MKTIRNSPVRNIVQFCLSCLIVVYAAGSRADGAIDPRTNSWFTAYSAKYARLYTDDAAKTAGTTVTTWSKGTSTQSLPAYDGVQEVDSSTNWVYIRSTGLGSHVMGPWYLNALHTQGFPNYPVNSKTLYRIPRSPVVPVSKTLNGGGAIGYFVDGVAMFNSWDAFTWNGTTNVGAGGGGGTVGYWNRDAFINEGMTFDAANAHQPNDGTYHYHANPPALRYFLGDHVDYNSTARTYTESTNAPTKHSPILGWVADGYPIYGPYGYASASNSASGIRRMISGYVPRNGQNGTDNLSTNGAPRSSLPNWAVRFYGVPANQQAGPTVSATYTFGQYMEDNAYLGDLTNSITGTNYVKGVDFDLDEYNGRWCTTPEFPQGVYAYFVSVAVDGTPVFPYNIGRAFYGSPTGSTVSSIAEAVVTNFLGGPNIRETQDAPVRSGNNVVLTWSAVEGGTVQSESDLSVSNWVSINTNTVSGGNIGTATDSNGAATSLQFYRIARTALASYDPVAGVNTNGGGGGNQTITMAPSSGTHGTNFSVTATISASATPPVPPMTGAPVQSFTVGTNVVTGASYTYNGGSGSVTGTLSLKNPTQMGSLDVTITFSPPPMQQQGPTYMQSGGFTVN